MKQKSFVKAIAGFLSVALIATSTPAVDVKAAAKRSVTISTQNGLNRALAKEDVTEITIKTSVAKRLVIPKGDYKDKTLIVSSPKLRLNNSGNFKTITINDAKAVSDSATGNIIKLKDTNDLKFYAAKGSKDTKIYVDAKGGNLDLVVNGQPAAVKVMSKTEVSISGSTKTPVPVTANSKASGAAISLAVPAKFQTTVKVDLAVDKGAENSSISVLKDNLTVEVTNNTDVDVKISDTKGNEVEVSAGTSASTNVTTGEVETEPTKAPEVTPEPTKAPEVTPEPTKAPEVTPEPTKAPEVTPGENKPGTGTETPGEDKPGTGTETPGENKPGTGTETPGEDKPGTETETPGEEKPGTGTETPGENKPGTGTETPGEEKPGTGTETPDDDKPGTGTETPDEYKYTIIFDVSESVVKPNSNGNVFDDNLQKIIKANVGDRIEIPDLGNFDETQNAYIFCGWRWSEEIASFTIYAGSTFFNITDYMKIPNEMVLKPVWAKPTDDVAINIISNEVPFINTEMRELSAKRGEKLKLPTINDFNSGEKVTLLGFTFEWLEYFRWSQDGIMPSSDMFIPYDKQEEYILPIDFNRDDTPLYAIWKHEHEWQAVTGAQATCTQNGWEERKCISCGKYDKIILPAGHDMQAVTGSQAAVTGSQAKVPTCTEEGHTGPRKCTRCDHTDDGVVLPKLDHKYKITKDTDATCEMNGYLIKVCDVCSVKVDEVRPKLGHNFVDGICTRCHTRE